MKKKVNAPHQTKVKDISSKETASDGVAINDCSQEKRHLIISQTDGCFLKFLNEDRQKLPSLCDITVTVCGKMYRAHKVVLAFGSGFFHAKLSENPELQHVVIDNIEVFIFGRLLDFLYTSEFEVPESQIPALSEAACFLEMMEAVNLLAKWATPAHGDEERDVQQVPAETPDVQTSTGGAQCSFCSRSFCYKKSLENHLARSHSAGCQVEDEQNIASTSVVTTRRSARQRRTPAKFEAEAGKSGPKTPKHDAAAYEEEESEEEQQFEQEEQSSKDGREETVEEAECEDGEKQDEEHEAEAQKETQHSQATNVFPEGLAPVVIQSANKKTLKCPKCDKTFDRIGENYNVKADGRSVT